jgi:hypothetical protein
MTLFDMAHDHFAQLDPTDATVIDAEHQEYPHHDKSAQHSHDQQQRETEDEEDLSFNDSPDARPPKQKKLPIPVLLGGGFIVFIALFAGYKKIFGHPAHASSVPTAVASLPADDSGAGNGSGGMMAQAVQAGNGSVSSLPAALPPSAQAAPAPLTAADLGAGPSTSVASLPSQATSLPATSVSPSAPNTLPGAVPAQQDPVSTSGVQSTGNPAPVATAAATATPEATATSTIMSAAAVPATAAQEAPLETRAAKIARLEHELSELRGKHTASKRVKHVASAKSEAGTTTETASTDSDSSIDSSSDAADQPVRHVSTRATRKSKHPRVLETQVGWHIKQVIPGQGWVEDENSGKQVVVSIGDRIGGAEVTKIDADGGKIYTTAGVIQ